MKKGFVLFLSIFFVAFTGFMPVKADNDITIGGNSYIDDYITNDEYKRINYSGLLMEYLRQGGTVDIANIDTNSNDLASDVLNNFGDFAVDVLRETGNFIDWIGNGDVFQEEIVVNRDPVAWKPALRQDVFQLIGQLPFMYLNSDDGNNPVPTPDPDYATYIDIINGSGFFWRNYSVSYDPGGGYYQDAYVYPYSSYSWIASNNTDSYNGTLGSILDYNDNALAFASNIITININEENGVYSFSNSWQIINPIAINRWSQYPYQALYFYKDRNGFDGRGMNVFSSYYIQYSGTLTQCLDKIASIFRNVNIYVNNNPWSIVGTPTNYNIQLGTGTVVPTTNGRVEWKYDDEIYIDIDLIWQLLDRFINDPNRTTTIIDFGVLEDCIVDANGQTAIAVKVIQDDPLSIDDQLVLDYGTLIPVFPVAVDYPIDVRDTARIAVIGVQVIPSDIIEIVILGIFGMLFVCFVHRGLE